MNHTGLWFVTGMIVSAIGAGYIWGVGYGVLLFGLWMIFAATFGEWE